MDSNDLERRVAALEAEMKSLRVDLQSLRTPPPPTPAPAHAAPSQPRPVAAKTSKPPISVVDVVARLGIVLLLLGVAFLLKLTMDYGWLTEGVRVVMGAGMGLGLLVTGTVMGDNRRSLGALLMGGGLVALYGTGFAAHVLYEFIGQVPAFVLMTVITLGGVVIAILRNRTSLAMVAALGGMATPFILERGEPDLTALAVHTAILLVGFSVIHVARKWDGVFAAAVIPGWFALANSASSLDFHEFSVSLLVMIGAVALPALTTLAAAAAKRPSGSFDRFVVLFSPLMAVVLIGDLTSNGVGVIVGIVMVLPLGILGALNKDHTKDRQTFIIAAVASAATAVLTLAGIDPIASALAAFTVAASFIGREHNDSLIRLPTVITLSAVGIYCIIALFSSTGSPPFFNPEGLLLGVGMLTLALSGATYETRAVRWLHFYGALAAFLTLVIHQLRPLALGEVLGTVIWGAAALILLVGGIAKKNGHLQVAGLLTIVLTAGKLLVFDLDSVATIWRVVLFLVFGAVLLVISYVVAKFAPQSRENP